MRYLVRTFLGMALFAFCWVAVGYGIYQLLQVGTCASGGPYVSARQCPDGTEAIVLALIGGILGLFIAAGIYITRGKPPGSSRAPEHAWVVVWFWTGLFWALAVGCFLGVWGPEANPGPGGETGGLIVGFMGAIMGAGGFLALGFGRRWRRSPAPEAVNPAMTAIASETGFNPVPVLVHVIAIAMGLYLGFVVMDAIAPDLPDPGVEPGVSSSVAPDRVAGDDPDSLLLAANLGPALAELDDQVAAGEGIVSLHIEPGAMDADTGAGDGLIDPEDVAPVLPSRITGGIDAERPGSTTLADVSFMDLVATAKGPHWYVQLDIDRDIGPPPWTYTAPSEGVPVSPGGAPPKPVGG